MQRSAIDVPPSVLLAIFMIFLLMGLIASAYGPLLNEFSERFEVPLPVAGSVLSAHFGGAFLGVIAMMLAERRLEVRVAVSLSLGMLAAGCVGIAVAWGWLIVLVSASIIGAGFGALALSLNQLVAYSTARRRGGVLSTLNSAYSIGAVAGPMAVATSAPGNISILYGSGAALALAMIVLILPVRGHLPHDADRRGKGPGALVGVFMLGFVLYDGLETGAGGWMPSHLRSIGLPAIAATALTSAYWLALAVGRALVLALPKRLREAEIVVASSAFSALAFLAATASHLVPTAYVFAGMVLAPIFPVGIVWLAKLKPTDATATSWLFPAAMLGGAGVPGLISLAVAIFGINSTPVLLAMVATGMSLTFGLAYWVARGTSLIAST